MKKSLNAAIVGALFAAPLLALNAMAGLDFPAFDRAFASVFTLDGYRTNPAGFAAAFAAIALMAAGGVIALRPAFGAAPSEPRSARWLSGLLGAGALLFLALFVGGMGVEAYRCDVAKIPNCD